MIIFKKNDGIIFIFDQQSSKRYFIHLHSISDHHNSILKLCISFENLLKQSDAYLFYHLKNVLNIEPLSVAYGWMVYGFVGILEPDQVLVLWDRMIGYNDTFILSMMAAAIFIFRRENLLRAHTEKEVENAFADLGMIKAIPVLQYFLFEYYRH